MLCFVKYFDEIEFSRLYYIYLKINSIGFIKIFLVDTLIEKFASTEVTLM